MLEFAYLNSHYQSGLKNLLDVAVLQHAEIGKNLHLRHQYEKTDEIPFDFVRRRLSVILSREDGSHVLICKGAVEEVFSVCKHYELGDELGTLDASHLAQAQAKTKELNEDGFRVVAVAYKEMPGGDKGVSVADESDLTLLGYIAFLDPPKESAGPAIRALNQSGVAVKILTGDNEVITRKICREVGLDVDRIVLGPEIEKLSDAELAELAPSIVVFAKVSPAQKARVIARFTPRATSSAFSATASMTAPRLEGRRRRRLGRHRRRHRQGIRRHHPARKEPDGASGGRYRRAQGLRQYYQIHQNGRQLELRQHVQRARRQHLFAVPADAAHSGADQQPSL